MYWLLLVFPITAFFQMLETELIRTVQHYILQLARLCDVLEDECVFLCNEFDRWFRCRSMPANVTEKMTIVWPGDVILHARESSDKSSWNYHLFRSMKHYWPGQALMISKVLFCSKSAGKIMSLSQTFRYICKKMNLPMWISPVIYFFLLHVKSIKQYCWT